MTSRTLRTTVRQHGFSMVELMVSVTIGLLLLAGLTTLFVNNSSARDEIEKTNRQIENGRYAVQLLTDDLRMAGFFGEFNPNQLTAPTAVPDPCVTASADLRAAMPLHVQGVDGTSSAPSVSCISDAASDSDVLVVRRVATCTVGSAGCQDESFVAGTNYFQASLCAEGTAELASGNVSEFYRLSSVATDLNRHKRGVANCSGTSNYADLRRYMVHVYFIANNSSGSDGIKTLKRAELGAGSFSVVPLVEGIENLQVEYGLDTDGNGTPDVYTTDPGTYNSCAAAACVTNWRNVMTMKVHLLARNTEKSIGHVDKKTYILGLDAGGNNNTVGPFADGYKRHVYQTVIRLPNPAGRRES